jgi:hypothetical protein
MDRFNLSAREACVNTRDLLASFDGRTIVQYLGMISEIIVPKNVQIIGGAPFHGCASITRVVFEDGLNISRLCSRAF